ncbi:MAG: PaaI family thioesterase [Methanobrevibacter sp.]|jgi:acyl-CoA thioesterase|nr:PaaI family thioesterase [Candidatus Methanoflexus mossambicus]
MINNIEIEKLKEFFDNDKLAKDLGIEIESATEEEITCVMNLTENHENSIGGIHGGAIFTLADFTFAVHSNLMRVLGDDKKSTVGQSCSISYLKPPKGDKLIAKSKCSNKGKTMSVYIVSITDEFKRPIAEMIGNGFAIDY